MIIRSIEIENFLSYYLRNSFDFSLGPTLIIGQNNTGKSKLFDAFNWALYDRAYKTNDEKWFYTKDWRLDLVNNRAKNQCRSGESINCSVCITFEDENDYKFILTREYVVRRNSDGAWDIGKNSSLSLSRTDPVSHNTDDFYEKDAEEQLKILFPDNLSKYFLFQGESISQIMSLSNKSSFNSALRDLSRIEVFEKAKAYSEKVLKAIKKEFENKDDADKALQQRKIELSKEVEGLREDLAYLNEQFDNECRERDLRKEQFDKKNDELKKYKECAQLMKEIDSLVIQRDTKNELRSELIENQKKDVFDKWMYAGSNSILQNFLAFYKKSKIERKIPEPIRQEFIKEMLVEEVCKVCDTHAPKGSPQYVRIGSYINDKSLDKEIELINQLSMVADNMLDKVDRTLEEIQSFYKRSDDIETQIKTFQNKIKIKEEELRNVIPSDISEDQLKAKDFSQLQKDRDNLKRDLEKSENKIQQIKTKREYQEKVFQDKMSEYDSLIESSSNTKERERYLLAEGVNKNTSLFHEHFLSRIISEIESNANSFFTRMTERNSALSGRVKVDYDNKEVYTISEEGNRLYNINQANKVSLQIAFVAAVLNVSNNFWDTYFPFIADAPISVLGGNNKLTAIETMIDIFKQSIIILKDDAVTADSESIKNDLIRGLIKNTDNIQYAYELVIEGDSEEDQITVVKKIKGK